MLGSPGSFGVILSSFCLSQARLLPWYCCRTWLTHLWQKKPTTFSKTHLHSETKTRMRTHDFYKVCFEMLSLVQNFKSKLLLANTARLTTLRHFLPLIKTARTHTTQAWLSSNYVYKKTPLATRSSSSSTLACKHFQETQTPLSSKLCANPCLDWNLTGFLQHPTPMT